MANDEGEADVFVPRLRCLVYDYYNPNDPHISPSATLYFLGTTSEADREYEHLRGWRSGIFEYLSLATRELLVEVLLRPYNDFCSAQKELKSLAALAPAPSEYESLYDTVQQLYYAPLYKDFMKQSFNSKDRKFVKDLESAIRRLNPLRNDAVHDHRRTLQSFEGDIRETYAEFLGIGRTGILPRLMRLHPKDKAKPSARR